MLKARPQTSWRSGGLCDGYMLMCLCNTIKDGTCFVQDENMQARVVLCLSLVVLEARVAVARRHTSTPPLESEKRVAEKNELLSVVGTVFNARLWCTSTNLDSNLWKCWKKYLYSLKNVNVFYAFAATICPPKKKPTANKSHFRAEEQRCSCVYPQLPASLRPNHLQVYKNNGTGPKKKHKKRQKKKKKTPPTANV